MDVKQLPRGGQRMNRVGVLGRLGVSPMLRLSLPGRRIMAFLALRGEPVLRRAAAAELWPDLNEETGRANLRRALWSLPCGWVEAVGDELLLNASTDIADAQDAAARALRGEVLAFADIERLSQDVLPGWCEEWIIPAQERFRLLRVQALEAACRNLAAAQQFALATQAGASAVAAEPLRESAAEALIDAHIGQRNRFEAVQCFRALEKRLKTELGVAPHPALVRRVADLGHR
jgi:DNA-binding SARP family transcriptional activator